MFEECFECFCCLWQIQGLNRTVCDWYGVIDGDRGFVLVDRHYNAVGPNVDLSIGDAIAHRIRDGLEVRPVRYCCGEFSERVCCAQLDEKVVVLGKQSECEGGWFCVADEVDPAAEVLGATFAGVVITAALAGRSDLIVSSESLLVALRSVVAAIGLVLANVMATNWLLAGHSSADGLKDR